MQRYGIKPIRTFWALLLALGVCGPVLCGLVPSQRAACAVSMPAHCSSCPRSAHPTPQGSAKSCCESYARLLTQSVDREAGVALVAAVAPAILQPFSFTFPERPAPTPERPQEFTLRLYERDVGPNRARAPPLDCA